MITPEQLWEKWKRRGITPKMTFIELKHLFNFLEEVEALYPEFDPETVDIEAILDPSLSYEENKQILAEHLVEIGIPYQVVEEAFYKTERPELELEEMWEKIRTTPQWKLREEIDRLKRQVKKLKEERESLRRRLKLLEERMKKEREEAVREIKLKREYGRITPEDIEALRKLSPEDLRFLLDNPEAFITKEGLPPNPEELKRVINQILREKGVERPAPPPLAVAPAKVAVTEVVAEELARTVFSDIARIVTEAIKRREYPEIYELLPEEQEEIFLDWLNRQIKAYELRPFKQFTPREIQDALTYYEQLTNPSKGLWSEREKAVVYLTPPERIRTVHRALIMRLRA